jgi:hypothetical protein
VAAGNAVDAVMAVADISVASANVTATVRLVSSALCVAALVVTPVAIVTVQRVLTSSWALAAVSVSAAVLVPEALPVTLKVVLPHPLMVGVANVPRVKSGKVRATSSLVFSGALNSKEYDTDDDADVAGLANVRLL